MMTESLLIRVKRIVTGGVAQMVGVIENAQGETVMREALREVEHAIDETRAEVGRIGAKRVFASRQTAMIREKALQFTDKARAALGEGRPDIAEALLARQIDLEAQIPIVERAEQEARADESELGECLAALQARKREMEADLDSFVAARRTASRETHGGAEGAPAAVASHRWEKASETFDRVMKNTSGVTGVAMADREVASKLAEFDALQRQRKIAERLAALQGAG